MNTSFEKWTGVPRRRSKQKPAWNKGKKFPHSAEWEVKRIAAVRAHAAANPRPRGYKRPKAHTQPMLDALAFARAENPAKYRASSIANLPSDVAGKRNGNWKGGRTLKVRGLRLTHEYRVWRQGVLDRDGHKCKICGSKNQVEVHHIIPMSECGLIALLPMNGVALCRKHHYENDEVWQGKRVQPIESKGQVTALIFSIPHMFQAYPTVGNWQFTKDGVPVIFVSRMSDPRYEWLVGIHELVEVELCRQRGITQKAVDEFDIAFEKKRKPDNDDEPGDDPKAPYRQEHFAATNIERLLAAEVGVDWAAYDKEICSLP